MPKEEPEFRPKRLWQRRWCRPCKDCQTPIIFLDETRPSVNGKPRGKWVVVEMYPERDGELLPWNGAIAYSPKDHVIHICVRERRRISWLIRQKDDDL